MIFSFCVSRSSYFSPILMSDYGFHIPISNAISDKVEMYVTYFLSLLFSFIIIFLVWNLIWKLFNKEVKIKHTVLFGLIFVLGAILILLLFPGAFHSEVDNFITFFYSKRFMPFYWHHIFTSCLYGACLMFFPHPITIQLLQWLAFLCAVAYVYINLENRFTVKWIKYVAFIFFVLPDSFWVVTNPYRNCMYTILCMFLFSYACFSILDMNAQRKTIIILALMSIFVATWRSEGLLLGVSAFLIYLFSVIKDLKKYIRYIPAFFACLFLFSLPQKMGNIKYYGNDYLIVSTMNQLQSVLNDGKSNLSYQGANEDLDIVNKVCPLNYIRQAGTTGFRCYNYQNGHLDINQTCLQKEETSKYVRACLRIFSHNQGTYLKHQSNLLFPCFNIDYRFDLSGYNGEPVEIPPFEVKLWGYGTQELYEKEPFVKAWNESDQRKVAADKIYKNRDLIFHKIINPYPLIFIILVVSLIFIVFREIFRLFKSKRETLPFGFMTLSLLGTLVLTALTMPEGRPAYFYPFIFASYLVLIMYFAYTFENTIKAAKDSVDNNEQTISTLS